MAEKKFPWGKIIKLALEFLLAVVTAIFASSCVAGCFKFLLF